MNSCVDEIKNARQINSCSFAGEGLVTGETATAHF